MIAARLVSPDDDLLLVSRHAQAIRFHASDDALRPMGRATSGVIGMRFTDGDDLLGMHVVRAGADVLVATGGGYAKRTPADQYPVQGRGGRGVLTARIVETRGELVGALMVRPEDEVFAITSAGGVIRTAAAEIKMSGRQTMGVRLVNLADGQSLVAIARNAESAAAVVEAGAGDSLADDDDDPDADGFAGPARAARRPSGRHRSRAWNWRAGYGRAGLSGNRYRTVTSKVRWKSCCGGRPGNDMPAGVQRWP